MHKLYQQCSRCRIKRIAHREKRELPTGWVCRLCKAQPHTKSLQVFNQGLLPENIHITVSPEPEKPQLSPHVDPILIWNVVILSSLCFISVMGHRYLSTAVLFSCAASLIVLYHHLHDETPKPRSEEKDDWY